MLSLTLTYGDWHWTAPSRKSNEEIIGKLLHLPVFIIIDLLDILVIYDE